MSDWSVPTADQLKAAAISTDLEAIVALGMSDIALIHTLANVGQAVLALRSQAAKLTGSQDEISIAILETHAAAESLLEQCAQTAHLVVKAVYEMEAKRSQAKFN